jgi:hypothetical protein
MMEARNVARRSISSLGGYAGSNPARHQMGPASPYVIPHPGETLHSRQQSLRSPPSGRGWW